MATYLLTAGDDTQTGTAGNDIFDGHFSGSTGGTDTLDGAGGNDIFLLDDLSWGTITGGSGTDTVQAFGNSLGTTITFSSVETLDVILPYIYITSVQLSTFSTIISSSRPDSQIGISLYSGGSIDFSTRFTGDYSVNFQSIGPCQITGTNNGDILEGSFEDDVLNGGGGNDTIIGNGGSDIVDGGDGIDTVVAGRLGTVSNVEILDSRGDNIFATIAQLQSFDTITDSLSPDSRMVFRLEGAGGSLDLSTRLDDHSVTLFSEAMTSGYEITGTNYVDYISGTTFDDILNGGDGEDQITNKNLYNHGFDIINGDGGNDIIAIEYSNGNFNGGTGNDTFRVDSGSGIIDGGDGVDIVMSTNLGSVEYRNVEKLDVSQGYVFATIGELLAFDKITSSQSVDSRIVFELKGGGGDIDFSKLVTVGHRVSVFDKGMTSGYTATGTALDDLFSGSAFGDNLRGGEGSDTLLGKAGDDGLRGGAGQDSLDGGAGNDTYFLENGNDSVSDSDGFDTISTTVTRSLTNYWTIERLVLEGAGQMDGYGNTLDNQIIGNGSVNGLNGGQGNDFLDGRDGNDGLRGGEGADQLYGGYGNDSLRGDGGVDHLYGGDGDDSLRGDGGIDDIDGGAGDDTYFLGADADIIVDSGGYDTISSSVTRSIVGYVSIERLVLEADAGNISGTGNSLNNAIYGNSGNNVLSGGAGLDTLVGGAGNDSYVLTDLQDIIIDSGGVDRIVSTISRSLADYPGIENLTLLGSANVHATGNSQINVLIGNSGSNILDGKGGIDTLQGLDGNDFYYVDHASDKVVEVADGGTDAVYASVNYTLAATADVEVLNTSFAGGTAAINLTGNGLDQVITGNQGANIIDGKLGEDVMKGLGGNDFYYVDNAADQVIEVAGGGGDAVYASVDYTLAAAADVEGLNTSYTAGTTAINLKGNELAQTVRGNAGNNSLFAGGGDDTLIGGLGRDALRGEAGNDTFDFNAVAETGINANTRDKIADFTHGQDIIDLSTIDANGAAAGDAFAFVGSGSFTFLPGQLRYFQIDNVNDALDETVIEADIDGNGIADFQIGLTGLIDLSASDFIL